MSGQSYEEWRSALAAACNDEKQILSRRQTAIRVSTAFDKLGESLHVFGHIFGPDRTTAASPFGHGSDDIVAVSRLLMIASQLLSASADLINDGRPYAGAALIRQLVEAQYLICSFAEDRGDAKYWLRSNKDERMKFFSPRTLRKKSGGRFRDKDYSMHCERGGHPVPDCYSLLSNTEREAQIVLADALLHAESILHFAEIFCTRNQIPAPDFISAWTAFSEWRKIDAITRLYLSPFNQGHQS